MQYDLIIIGSGPAGYVGAVRAAKHGMKTAIIEKEATLGGTCLNWGCIPTKTLLKTAKVIHTIRDAEKFGVRVNGEMSFDFDSIMKRKEKVVKRIVKGVDYLMKANKIDVIRGEASFVDTKTVKTPDGNLSAQNILIATGAQPARPPIPGLDSANVLTSREILDLKACPESLVVIGAGVIGMEFASFFRALGVEVTVIEMLDEVLPMIDPEIAVLFKRQIEKEGVKFHLSSKVSRIEDGKVFFSDKSGQEQSVDAEKILLSIGTVPNLAGLDLDRVGVRTEKRAIVTDVQMRTNIPGIYAAGDVNGVWMLAHKASREAEVAVDVMAGEEAHIRYRAIPSCIYTSPEIATVGLSEKEASTQGIPIRIAKYDLVANGRFLAETEGERGLVKAIIGKEHDELLGLHIIAPYASEIITVGTQGIEMEMLVKEFDEIVFPHPTICESVREAILS
ncbi:dihydrolipoyl dehydrogenase [Candidatus Vecturithrix granuli]|uniref:Dihydrolipoyl dehydrogenase n=1 Tax=Vecturithrix granuli TaxID=1499967 RepID=A0A081C0K3_VECG1|nr:dihydrolipoyl dehydrogenase [Candidatus Vecturithrix granuli]